MLHQATNSRFSVRLFCLHAWGALDYHADSGHSDQQKSFDDNCVEEDGLDESKLVSWSTYISLSRLSCSDYHQRHESHRGQRKRFTRLVCQKRPSTYHCKNQELNDILVKPLPAGTSLTASSPRPFFVLLK